MQITTSLCAGVLSGLGLHSIYACYRNQWKFIWWCLQEKLLILELSSHQRCWNSWNHAVFITDAFSSLAHFCWMVLFFQPSLVYLAASPYHSICLTGAPSFLRYNFGTISIINVVFILVFWILYCYSWRQNLRRSPNDMLFESVPFLHHCDTNLVSIFTIFITPQLSTY